MTPRNVVSSFCASVGRTALRTTGLMFGFALLAAVTGLIRSHAAEPAPAMAEAFDLLYLSDARPIVIRMHVTKDGKPIQEAWDRFADVLFAKLDADKNGAVEEMEWARLAPIVGVITHAAAPRNEFTAPHAPMNRAEFGEFLRNSSVGPLRISVAPRVQPSSRMAQRLDGSSRQELDKLLLDLLDTNKDGRISAMEFTAGIEILSGLDTDENELVSADEIRGRPSSPNFADEMAETPYRGNTGLELLLMARKGKDANLAKQIVARYDPTPRQSVVPRAKVDSNRPRPKPNMRIPKGADEPLSEPDVTIMRRLTNKDLKLSEANFGALDQDGDGELDAEELARFARHALVDVEIAMRFGNQANDQKPAEVILEGKPPLKVFAGPHGAEPRIAIEMPAVRFDLISSASGAKGIKSTLSDAYLGNFRFLDRGGKGYVEENEVGLRVNFPELNAFFTFFDRDGDGKIYEKELKAVIDEIEDIANAAENAITSIILRELSDGLFGLIDANGDGKLSIRELRAMPKLVERFGSNKEAGLAIGDLPRRFEASVSIGMGRAALAPQGGKQFGPNHAQPARAGPLWFQKMDRNRDGDVSRREFLGTDEQFRKLDTDGDGLISVQEAEAAEK